MKTNISSDRTDKRKNYIATYFSQGKNITDFDLNAMMDDLRHNHEDLVETGLASMGSPDFGFKIDNATVSSGGIDFDLLEGSFLIGGIVIHADSNLTFLNQSDFLTQPIHETLDAPTTQELANGDRFDAVWLEMIKMPVRAVEDGELRETALTASTHSRGRPQTRIFASSYPGENCQDARDFLRDRIGGVDGFFEPNSPQLHSNGRLRVNFEEANRNHDPCAPDIPRGHRLYENQTIKVKMQPDAAFNWAYDNGDELHRVELIRRMENGTQHVYLRFVTPLNDPKNLPRRNQIAEICPFAALLPNFEKTAELNGFRSRIIGHFNTTSQEIEIEAPIDPELADWWDNVLPVVPNRPGDTGRYIYLRLWEPPADANRVDDPVGPDVPLADTGVHLQFLAQGVVGDEWTFSLRLSEPEQTVPWQYTETEGAPPSGPERNYVLLAQIRWYLDNGRIASEISDCRPRFRQPGRDMGCCTFTVGDGQFSHGDYDRLEDAIEALPARGGHICLLPGTHQGGVRLIDLQNVTISGCGAFSTVESIGEDPVFDIDSGANITLRDFSISDRFSLAIGATDVEYLALKSLTTTGYGEALSVIECEKVNIHDCTFEALAYPPEFDLGSLDEIRALAFVGGNYVDITHCRFLAERQENFLRQGHGGLQIASRSSHVNVRHNHIQGGAGIGLTLGNLTETRGRRRDPDIDIREYIGAAEAATYHSNLSKWDGGMKAARYEARPNAEGKIIGKMVSYDAPPNMDAVYVRYNPGRKFRQNRPGCMNVDPRPKNPKLPNGPGDYSINWTAYGIEHLHVEDNEINDMGASGISIPVWFSPNAQVQGRFTLRNSRISDNHISNVVNLPLPEDIEDDELLDIALGGITLDDASDLIIENNKIDRVATRMTLGVCGIYLGSGSIIRISGNSLTAIGQAFRSSTGHPAGITGGIVVDDVVKHGALKGTENNQGLTLTKNNVAVGFGAGIDVRGAAPLSVNDNRVMSLGSEFSHRRFRLGHTFSVVNIALPTIEAYSIVFLISSLLYKKSQHLSGYFEEMNLPFGWVPTGDSLTCHDNEIIARFDEIRTELFPFSSTAFVTSNQDVTFQSNTVKNTANSGSYLSEIGAFSLTNLRCLDNLALNSRKTVVPGGITSVAMLNTTANNQSSHPNWLIGFIKRSGFTSNMVFGR